MDIQCSICGEPWDNDCLHESHDFGAPKGLSYTKASSLFQQYGCGLFRETPTKCTNKPCVDLDQLTEIQVKQILSDYSDDWS